MIRFALFALLAVCFCNPSYAIGHRALVAQSGIRPRQVGTHEGVGVSTRSAADAIRNACFWGRRQPIYPIQTSYRGGRFYAVVRYR